MTATTENQPAQQAQPERSWVCHCTDASIAAGQVSVLAVVEIIAAVGMYWWMAMHFDWPWMAFVGMLAAPMLLMRSEKSIALGVELLRRYWEPEVQSLSHSKKISIFLFTAIAVGYVSYWQALHWLVGHGGLSLLWRAAVLGPFGLAYAFAFAIVIASALVGVLVGVDVAMATPAIVVVGAGAVAVAVAGAGAGTVASAVVMASLMAGAIAVAVWSAGPVFSVVEGVLARVVATFLAPFFALGFLGRGLLIRLYATFHHPLAGLAQLPQNWRETLAVIDLSYLPELLPQAGNVADNFAVKGLWKNRNNTDGFGKAPTVILILAWYIPALAYRWSLKASAWLWWPLALALTPPLHKKKDQDTRQLMAIITGWLWLYESCAFIIFIWLLTTIPTAKTLIAELPQWLSSTSKHLPPAPPFGLRFILTGLGLLFIGLMIYRLKNLKAAHGKTLETATELPKYAEEDRAEFIVIAKGIDKIRLLFITTVFFWGEAMAISFAHTQNPQLIEVFFPAWLFAYL